MGNLFVKLALLLLGVLMAQSAFADCARLNACDDNNWRFIVGGQFSHRSPKMHYEEKNGSPPRQIDIKEEFTEDRYLPFPMMRLEYRINESSFLDLTYNKDDTDTSALERKRVRFLFFPLTLGIRTPLKIDTESLKLRYNRRLFKGDDWELGAAVGLQVLKIDINAQIPVTGEENDSLIAPLPNFGLYATYWQSDQIGYHLRADYLPLNFKSTKGDVAEVDFSAEYQYNKTWLMGVGYRYAHLKLDLDRENYRADVSHITYGPTIFVGASF